MAGAAPETAAQVNSQIGGHMRTFVLLRDAMNRSDNWLDGVNLQNAPYNMSAGDEAVIKSAVSQLDAVFEGLSAELNGWITQLTGPF